MFQAGTWHRSIRVTHGDRLMAPFPVKREGSGREIRCVMATHIVGISPALDRDLTVHLKDIIGVLVMVHKQRIGAGLNAVQFDGKWVGTDRLRCVLGKIRQRCGCKSTCRII